MTTITTNRDRPRRAEIDEPSLGLAPLVIEQVYAALREVRAADALAMLLVEQNARVALEMADRVHVLETGRCVPEGSADEVDGEDVARATWVRDAEGGVTV